MDAILLIIGIVYEVCRIGLAFLFLSEFVNEAGLPAGIPCISFGSDIVLTLRSTEDMRERLVTSKVSFIRRERDQIKNLQENDNSMVIFVLKRRKVVR